ncbi:MAG: hypothetical protein QG652_231 [Pseudomonadota bacterium]|nr:hypothetical protein [Pseudomonadota bacterium]
MMKQTSKLCAYLIFLLPFASATAADIEKVMPNGLIANADYFQGDADKPAILLLHGFLTVHHFNLIKNISTELADNHYSVLAPTLTLGISRRKTTLDCDALHLHSMESDLKEIDWWVKWLIEEGHKEIILIGHSSGAIQLTDYASKQKYKEIKKLVALSMIPLADKNNSHFLAASKKAAKLLQSKDNSIQNFTLAYCIDNYSAPASEYMSYAVQDFRRILQTLHSVQTKTTVIMGGNDIPVYPNWLKDIKDAGARVKVIDGADHFFGSGTEFELYDDIMQAIADRNY